MTDKEKVLSVAARFFNVPEAAVTENFVFPKERLHGSVARAIFHAAIKRIAGVDLPAAFSANNFGELFGQPKPPANENEPANIETVRATSSPTFDKVMESGSGVGIDIEDCDSLPAASDPLTEPFYAENFTPAEITYCLRQKNARESFCGLWCAKEAVIKCGSEFSRLRPIEIEIGHDTKGQPGLSTLRAGRLTREKDCFISISHSHGISVAVCVSGIHSKPATGLWDDPPSFSPAPASDNVKLAWFGLALGLINFFLWLANFLKK